MGRRGALRLARAKPSLRLGHTRRLSGQPVPQRASLVVPAYNALPLLRYTLESLRHQNAPAAAFEVIVVDDASEDGTSAWLSSYHPPYRLVRARNEDRLGRSATRNHGLRLAAGEVVIFLDADMICPPRLVATHLRLHAEGEAAGVETCVTGYPWFWRSVASWDFGMPQRPLLDPELLSRWGAFERWAGGPLGAAGAALAVARPDEAPFVWCITRVLSVRRAVAADVGGFDERFQGYGYEDWEFGYRLARRGVRIVAHPDAAAFHQEHPATGHVGSPLDRNYGLFLELHPDFEVALLSVCPTTSDTRFARLCAAHHRLWAVAPAFAAALQEVLVDYARARHAGSPHPVRGWGFWTAHWGAQRLARIAKEQLAAMSDGRARPAVALFQKAAGLVAGDPRHVCGR